MDKLVWFYRLWLITRIITKVSSNQVIEQGKIPSSYKIYFKPGVFKIIFQ